MFEFEYINDPTRVVFGGYNKNVVGTKSNTKKKKEPIFLNIHNGKPVTEQVGKMKCLVCKEETAFEGGKAYYKKDPNKMLFFINGKCANGNHVKNVFISWDNLPNKYKLKYPKKND